jgi:hypothetical protein
MSKSCIKIFLFVNVADNALCNLNQINRFKKYEVPNQGLFQFFIRLFATGYVFSLFDRYLT